MSEILSKIMASAVTDKMRERRNRVFLGPLPEDFLRITATVQQQQEAADRQTALALHQQLAGYQQPHTGRLSITVAQAKLVKNYGMTRMDPYVRIRVGHCVYETHTDPNGSKNPRWNRVVHCLLPKGVNTISLEIYDERSFTMDELIASCQILIPPKVMAGETSEEWYPLSGKQGEGEEGSINLVLSYTATPSHYGYTMAPVMMVPNVAPRGVTPMTAPPGTLPMVEPAPIELTPEDLKQLQDMFPAMDKEVISLVFVANNGNKEKTIDSLFRMIAT